MAKERKKYIPSYKRADNPPPMRRSKYDRPVLQALEEYRLLSAPQIEALCFASQTPRGCRTYCQRRLQLLYHHGLLGRIALPLPMGEGRAPFVYFLDESGIDLAVSMSGRDRAELGWKPESATLGTQFVTHTLAVNDFRVAMTLLARSGRRVGEGAEEEYSLLLGNLAGGDGHAARRTAEDHLHPFVVDKVGNVLAGEVGLGLRVLCRDYEVRGFASRYLCRQYGGNLRGNGGAC